MKPSSLFPMRNRPPTHRPHVAATLIWSAWALLSLYAIATGSLVAEAVGLFLVLELVGAVLDRPALFGFTFSEIVWWYVPWLLARWALAVFYGGAFAVYVSPVAGLIFLFWLIPHFVAVGRDFRRYDRRVAALAARAFARDEGAYPSSVDYLTETAGDDPELVRAAQWLYVRLEQDDRAAWVKVEAESPAEILDEFRR